MVIPMRGKMAREERRLLGKDQECTGCKMVSGMAFICSILAQ